MSCLESLVAADRVVIAGLAAYDQITGRELARFRTLSAEAGHAPDEIERQYAEHAERIRIGRGRLHRQLWTKALAQLADRAPDYRTGKEPA